MFEWVQKNLQRITLVLWTKVLMNSNKSPSIVAGMCFIGGFIHFLSILEFCTSRSQTLNHTQASCSSHSFLFELYSTLKASLRMHEWTSFSPSENFVLIAEKREGCLEKEGETMKGGVKAFRCHYERCPRFFPDAFAVCISHNNSLWPLCASCLSEHNNSEQVLHQGYGNATNTGKSGILGTDRGGAKRADQKTALLILCRLCTQTDERKETLPKLYIRTYSVWGSTLRWPDHLVERAGFV